MNLFIVCLFLTSTVLGFSSASIDPRSPGNVRAILGEQMQIPCAVVPGFDRYNGKISLVRPTTGLRLNLDGPEDARFAVGFESDTALTAMWKVNEAHTSDAGTYMCIVRDEHGSKFKKTINVTILVSSDGLKWNSYSRCEYGAECDPLGAFPCCSEYNWCGFSADHCDCSDCVDYRLGNVTSRE